MKRMPSLGLGGCSKWLKVAFFVCFLLINTVFIAAAGELAAKSDDTKITPLLFDTDLNTANSKAIVSGEIQKSGSSLWAYNDKAVKVTPTITRNNAETIIQYTTKTGSIKGTSKISVWFQNNEGGLRAMRTIQNITSDVYGQSCTTREEYSPKNGTNTVEVCTPIKTGLKTEQAWVNVPITTAIENGLTVYSAQTTASEVQIIPYTNQKKFVKYYVRLNDELIVDPMVYNDGLAWDDFEDADLNGTLWQSSGVGGTLTEIDGTVTITSSGGSGGQWGSYYAMLDKTSLYPANRLTILIRFKSTAGSDYRKIGLGWGGWTNADLNTGVMALTFANNATHDSISFSRMNSAAATSIASNAYIDVGAYYWLTFKLVGTYMNMSLYADDAGVPGIQIRSGIDTTNNYTSSANGLYFADYNIAGSFVIDEVGVNESLPYTAPASSPSFSAVNNNASILSQTGSVVNWTTTVTSTSADTIWFTHNDSGTFVNKTVMKYTSPFTLTDNVTITATALKSVCGFFGANTTAGLVTTTALSCFTVADIETPTFTNAANNASSLVINNWVNWSVNLADNIGLSFVTFSTNSSGSWVNDTPIKISGTSRSVNVTHSEAVTPLLNICGRFYFNDTFGNQNMSQSCYVASNLYRINFTLKSRDGNALQHWANLSNGTNILYNVSGVESTIFDVVPGLYNITLNTTSFGSTNFMYNFTANLNFTTYLPNITYLRTPASVVSTQIETFILGMSGADDFQYSNILFVFNGTSYATSRLSGTGGVNYTASITIPTITYPDSAMPYYWNYTILGQTNRTEQRTVFVNTANIVNCSAGSINQSINFSIYDENSPTSLLVSAIEVTFNIGNNENRNLLNLSYTLNGSSSYAFCIGNASFQADVYFKHTPPGSFTHRYYMINATLTNTTSTVNAYNFISTTDKSTLKVTVRDVSTYQPLIGVTGILSRNYVGEGVWRVVQMDRTDDYGSLIYHIIEQSQDYKIILYDENGQLLKQTDSMKFVCTSSLCDITIVTSAIADSSAEAAPGTKLTYNNATKVATVSWSDSTGVTQTVRVLATKQTIAGVVSICDTTTASSTGSVGCNLTNYPGEVFVQVIVNGDAQFGQWVQVSTPGLSVQIGDMEGAVWTAAGVIVAIGFGIALGPVGAIMSVTFILVAFGFLGIFSPLNVTVLITFAIVSAIIGVVIRK